MKESIHKTDLPREGGFIYFVKGNPLEIWRAPRGRQKKAEKVEPETETPAEAVTA